MFAFYPEFNDNDEDNECVVSWNLVLNQIFFDFLNNCWLIKLINKQA